MMKTMSRMMKTMSRMMKTGIGDNDEEGVGTEIRHA
jgi:hypothetical protein